MDIIEAIRTRRTIKDFAETPVAKEILLEVIDAARYSPTGGNKNSWRFILITSRRTLDSLGETHPHCRWFHLAQAGIALVINPISTRFWLEDCCVVAHTIWMAAHEKGLGLAWAAMYQADDREESERRQRYVRRMLGIPAGIQVPIVLGLGYPKATPPTKKRPGVEELILWESYTPR